MTIFLLVTIIIFEFLLIYGKAVLAGIPRRMLIHYKLILSGRGREEEEEEEEKRKPDRFFNPHQNYFEFNFVYRLFELTSILLISLSKVYFESMNNIDFEQQLF